MTKQKYSFQTVGEILLGEGAANDIASRIEGFEAQKVVILTDRGVYDSGLTQQLESNLESEGLEVVIYNKVESEPTVQSIEDCFREIKEDPIDLVIGLGGGSSMDTAKVIAVKFTNEDSVKDFIGTNNIKKPGLPTILVPTTAGTGAEVTPISIVTLKRKNRKAGIISSHLFADLAVVDPLMTLSLPPGLTASTGIDALTHALESYISVNSNRLSDIFALKAIELILKNLKVAFKKGDNIKAREAMMLGSTFGGIALSIAGTAAVHALAYPLGGKFGIPHGIANSILLPHVMKYNKDEIIEELAQVAQVMELDTEGADQKELAQYTLDFVNQLTKALGIPTKLGEFGVSANDLNELSELALKVKRLLQNNPKPLGKENIKAIYEKAL